MGIEMGLFRTNEKLEDQMQGLERFLEAQKRDYQLALSEVRAGKKQSHWIWYIFPQMYGLGSSYFAQLYGIHDREEAEAYLNHEVLGKRLREITIALLEHDVCSAEEIFGDLDAMKVRSCMTLFDIVSPDDIFDEVLNKFYDGKHCRQTTVLLYGKTDISDALSYIGVKPEDFNLNDSMFHRSVKGSIHGIGHVYRVMIGCSLLGQMLQKPRESLLAFCGAYIHDLARETDWEEPDHGENAVRYYFDRFANLWEKYKITEKEKIFIKDAVAQHSKTEILRKGDEGYDVMAILKDADALDRCRLFDLNPRWLRYPESRYLIKTIEEIYLLTRVDEEGIEFRSFVKMVNDNL